MAELSLGILIDVVDEEWMRDTLPDDGIFLLFNFISHLNPITWVFLCFLYYRSSTAPNTGC